MNFKKLTSWLLSLVMIVSLLPMAAFAESPSVNTVKVSDNATSGFDAPVGDISVDLGNTIYIKLYTNGNEVTGYTKSNFTYSTNSDAEITVENNTIKVVTKEKTDYIENFKVSYDGKEWSFNISISGGSNVPGNPPVDPSLYKLQYATGTDDTVPTDGWNDYSTALTFNYNNSHSAPSTVYYLRVIKKDTDPAEQAIITGGGPGLTEGSYNSKGNCEYRVDNGYAKLLARIGSVNEQMDGVYGDKFVVDFMVNGQYVQLPFEAKAINYVPYVPTYADATIIQETVGTGTITVATIPSTSAAIDNDTDFSLDAGVLTFTKDGKSAGNYDVIVIQHVITCAFYKLISKSITEKIIFCVFVLSVLEE
ncbi:MAG: hypothetical protein E7488_06260, partial [Ruminococcaceae bacterium]|nr:hypothetical protein [Oscillospiraceae bacterium]